MSTATIAVPGKRVQDGAYRPSFMRLLCIDESLYGNRDVDYMHALFYQPWIDSSTINGQERSATSAPHFVANQNDLLGLLDR